MSPARTAALAPVYYIVLWLWDETMQHMQLTSATGKDFWVWYRLYKLRPVSWICQCFTSQNLHEEKAGEPSLMSVQSLQRPILHCHSKKQPAALGMMAEIGWVGKTLKINPSPDRGLAAWHVHKIHWDLIQPVAKSLHPAFSLNCAPWMRDCRKSSRFVVSCFGPTSTNHATYSIQYHPISIRIISIWLHIPPLESTWFPGSLRSQRIRIWNDSKHQHLFFLCRLFGPDIWIHLRHQRSWFELSYHLFSLLCHFKPTHWMEMAWKCPLHWILASSAQL